MGAPSPHETYIAAAPEALQPGLRQLRARLAETLPDAEEILRYDMPGFAKGGTVIAGYAAFKAQCGLYVSPGAIAACEEEIAAAGLKATKTGVTFSPKTPLPDGLAEALARASRRDLAL
ncbi:iron chaperone [Pseudoroseicyclus sp. CXY001]|uniref:iron chaperone n=1 Tax=Pseudoroseicyclus sp. CXY001 TaxID=3242492 RepID=UPI0035711482